MLRRITGKDFGYDLAAWHNHLKESRQGGYTYGRNVILPKIMQAALASDAWRNAAACLAEKGATAPVKPGKPERAEDWPAR
jgi:hypothetical protein